MGKAIAAIVVVLVVVGGIYYYFSQQAQAPSSQTPTPTPTPAATPSGTPPPASSTPTPAAAKTVPVSIANFAYSPSEVRIKAGDKVVWTNNDLAGHTVTVTSAGLFDSKTLGQGKTFEHTFTAKGTFTYRCTLHPSMTGTVIVE